MKVCRHLEFACTTESFIHVWICGFLKMFYLFQNEILTTEYISKTVSYFSC